MSLQEIIADKPIILLSLALALLPAGIALLVFITKSMKKTLRTLRAKRQARAEAKAEMRAEEDAYNQALAQARTEVAQQAKASALLRHTLSPTERAHLEATGRLPGTGPVLPSNVVAFDTAKAKANNQTEATTPPAPSNQPASATSEGKAPVKEPSAEAIPPQTEETTEEQPEGEVDETVAALLDVFAEDEQDDRLKKLLQGTTNPAMEDVLSLLTNVADKLDHSQDGSKKRSKQAAGSESA